MQISRTFDYIFSRFADKKDECSENTWLVRPLQNSQYEKKNYYNRLHWMVGLCNMFLVRPFANGPLRAVLQIDEQNFLVHLSHC